MPLTIHLISGYFTGHVEPGTWYLPYKMKFPWTQSTALRFILMAIMEYALGFHYFWICTSALQFFAGICFYVSSFCVDIRQQFDRIDALISDGKSNSNATKGELLNLVKFHIDILTLVSHSKLTIEFHLKIKFFRKIKRLTNDMKRIISGAVFFVLLPNVFIASTTLFHMTFVIS